MGASKDIGAGAPGSLVGSLVRGLGDDPGGTAWSVRFGSHWVGRSKGDVEAILAQITAGLGAWGVGQGDRVALWGPCCESWVLVDFAAMACGAISAGVPVDTVPGEFAQLIDELEPAVLAVEYSRETLLYLFSLGVGWWEQQGKRGMKLLLLEREWAWENNLEVDGGGEGWAFSPLVSAQGQGQRQATGLAQAAGKPGEGGGGWPGSTHGQGDRCLWDQPGRFGPGSLSLSGAFLPIPVLGLDAICALGREGLVVEPGLFKEMVDSTGESDSAAIFYTAGEGDRSRGALFNNGALLKMMGSPRRVYLSVPHDVLLIFLPLSHVLQRAALWEALLAGDVNIYLEHGGDGEGNLRLEATLLEVKPTILVTGPTFWEGVYTKLLETIEDLPVATRTMAYGSLGIARQVARERGRGDQPRVGLALVRQVLDKALYSKLREGLGGNLRLAVCGGAGLSPWLGGLFNAMGVAIYEGWSMAEAGGMVTLNVPRGVRPGTKGRPLQRFSLQVGEDGRVFVRGEGMFTAYWRKGGPGAGGAGKEPRVDYGAGGHWFDTGDVGMLDGDGYLKLLGKGDSVYVAPGGALVGVSEAEDRLRTEPYVSHVLVHGRGRPHPVALVVPHWGELVRWAAACGEYQGDPRDVQGVVKCPQLAARFQKVLAAVNRGLPPEGQVEGFRFLSRQLDPFAGEVSGGGKMRRRVVEETFAQVLDQMYE